MERARPEATGVQDPVPVLTQPATAAAKTDWVAEVFAAMRDCGEDISIVFGSLGSGAHAKPQWFELQHDQFDGISGLVTLLREHGLRVDAMPTLRGDRRTLARSLQGLWAVLPSLKIRQRTWKQFDGTRPASLRPAGERIAWKLFSSRETATLVAAAQAAEVTVNTYLLHHLDAAVAQRLTPASSGRMWMIPVNLRGAVTRPNPAAPHMAFLGVQAEGVPSAAELQAQITRLRQRGYHWGSWAALHIGRVIGARALRTDYVSREKKHHGWTGIFSNLGAWSVPGSESWIFAPAISRVHPVGAGCVTMNGRMALSIQLHEAFGADAALAQALLDDWAGAVLRTATPAQALQAFSSTTSQQVASYG